MSCFKISVNLCKEVGRVHVMSCFKISVNLCKEVEGIMVRFWWSGTSCKLDLIPSYHEFEVVLENIKESILKI